MTEEAPKIHALHLPVNPNHARFTLPPALPSDAMGFTPNLGAWQVMTPEGESNSPSRGNGPPHGVDIDMADPKEQGRKRCERPSLILTKIWRGQRPGEEVYILGPPGAGVDCDAGIGSLERDPGPPLSMGGYTQAQLPAGLWLPNSTPTLQHPTGPKAPAVAPPLLPVHTAWSPAV